MILTFDDTKNMYSETLRVFKSVSDLPKCTNCGGKLGYNKSIAYIACGGILPSGQRCNDRHGRVYKEVFEFDEEQINEVKEFSAYCQTLKKHIKSHSHFKLHTTLPIRFATDIKYNKKHTSTFENVVKFCEQNYSENKHLAKEVSLTLHQPELSEAERNEKLYEITQAQCYLSAAAKELFVF